MLGAIIGDIAGSVYEFGGVKTKDFPLFGDYRGEKCRFTDDSAMTLAAAGALLETAEEGSDLSANAAGWVAGGVGAVKTSPSPRFKLLPQPAPTARR